MTNRIDAKFAELKHRRESGFIAYITAGDPNLEQTVRLVPELEKAGVDLIELGVPFSDPLADGIVNQMAAQRALDAGTTVAGVFRAIAEIRQVSQIPIVLYTYLNPVYIHGFENFHREAAAVGVDGVLILDLPPEEMAANRELSGLHGLKAIRLIAPTTSPARLGKITASAEGFIYYVSREGVTGERTDVADTLEQNLFEIKKHTDLPVAVGFGISTPEQASIVGCRADAVVVGSAIVRRMHEHAHASNFSALIADFVRPLAAATHQARQTPS
jgi:tryptophan synthase alpha chain